MKRFTTFLLLLLTLAISATAGEARYIFYFIGDGMGLGHAMGAEAYNRTVAGNDTPITMMQFPIASQCTTHSASSPVTDSAAAGTALATGSKTLNRMLGMARDSTNLTSIATQLQQQGYGIGIITTEDADDATPGAFYAHVSDRGMFYEIGCDAARCGFDFIAGRNLRGMSRDGKPTDLAGIFADNGVDVVRGLDALGRSEAKKVVLLDSLSFPDVWYYTIDSVPGLTLASMTESCMKHLKKNGRDKWFIMVEGGNIDHAGHANDAGTIIKEVLNYNDVIRMAYDFYLAHPDETLIVVTADHETGGMGLGNNALGYNIDLRHYDRQRVSKERFTVYCRDIIKSGKPYSWEEMKDYLSLMLGFWDGVPVSDKDTERLRKIFDKAITRNEGTDNHTLYKTFDQFTETVYHILDKATGIGWTSNNHTAGLVPVYAIGVGAERFAGFNDNTMIPSKIMESAR
ncbi:alkaline phosphatase [uncultured Muribaculum sp.]|uniref:alkaline phosphatase n=1 Tax=uncultured Muribaculum sp. TaxID=1918613 RepID=UPI0025D12EFC|nr:alkaline phosphatase [uncultured Muribaculum sp.]